MKYNETLVTENLIDLIQTVDDYEEQVETYKVKTCSSKISALPREAGVLLGEQVKDATPFPLDLGNTEKHPIDTPLEGVQEAMDDGVAMAVRFNSPKGVRCIAIAPTAKEPLLRCAGLLCPTLAGQSNSARDELSPEFVSLVYNQATKKYKGNAGEASLAETPDAATFTAVVQDGQLRYAGRLYKYVPISEALAVSRNSLEAAFPEAEFKQGEFSHAGISAIWNLGRTATEGYLSICSKTLVSKLLDGAEAQVEFNTSNVSDSAVRLTPRLVLPGGVTIPAGREVAVPHRGDKPLEKFTAEAVNIGKAFSEAPAELEKLEETIINNPSRALMKVFESIGRKSAKWVERAQAFETYFPYDCTALDILAEALEGAKEEIAERHLKLSEAADLCDAIARKVMAPTFKKTCDIDAASEEAGVIAEDDGVAEVA